MPLGQTRSGPVATRKEKSFSKGPFAESGNEVHERAPRVNESGNV